MQQRQLVRPITYLKSNASGLVRDVVEHRHAVTITQNGEARVVVMDVETYDAWRETTALLKIIALGQRDVAAGRLTPQDVVFREIEGRLRSDEDG